MSGEIRTGGAGFAALAAALLLFVACSPKPGTPGTVPHPPSDAAGTAADAAGRDAAPDATPAPAPAVDHTPLYDELARQVGLYEEGVGLLREGDETAGEEQIRSAKAAISEGFRVCRTSPGCDINRFHYAFERLLDEQNLAIKVQALRISDMEAAAVEETEVEAGTSPFNADIPEIERTASLLRGTDFREAIQLNGPVRAAMDDWLTWLRPMLIEAHENYQFLRDRIAPYYREAGLPEALLFGMIATETGGKAHSVSHAGAAGLLQFIRHTGMRYGLGVEDGFDTRFDPRESARANVAYLNDLFELLNEDLEKALAAYNGGENRIRRLDRRFDTPPFWDERFYYSLPRETREYVPRILAAAWLFLHPEEYGLEFPRHDTALTELDVRRDTTLSELTICLGQTGNPRGWFRTLRNLNPRIEPADAIEAGATLTVPVGLVPLYEERCVEDSELLARARELHEANYSDQREMIRYTVRRGDTLGSIASRYSCASLAEIAALNEVRPPRYVISVGQTLRIPVCS